LELPELEQRLSNLQSQVERLWRKAEASVPPIEQRLAVMADQYAEYLKRWAATVERHTQAVSQLEAYASEWKDASTRVRQETAERLHELETTIEHEWDTLKRMQEEPIRELREQAESLTQVSLAMANASQQGVERAEARFAAFETEVHLRLNELTRELTTAIAEMKARIDRQAVARDSASQWSLDDVTRLHGQLRDGARTTGEFPQTIEHGPVTSPRELPPGDVAPSYEQKASERKAPEHVTLGGRPVPDNGVANGGGIPTKWLVAGAIAAVVLVAGIFGWRLQSQIATANERALIAQQKADTAMSDAARQTAEAQRAAAEQIDEARQMVARTQRIGSVTSAPDLIRFNLSGANGASGQALFSRSRGLVVNGFRLPSPNGILLAWLLTPQGPLKAGALAADADGSFALVQELPSIPRRVIGVIVTEETSDTADAPSGPPVITSVAPAAAAEQAEQP
jgi:hypothetical protein